MQYETIRDLTLTPVEATVTFPREVYAGVHYEVRDQLRTYKDARDDALGSIVESTVKDVTWREGIKFYLLIGEGDSSRQGNQRTIEVENGTSFGQSQVNALFDNGERAANTLLLVAGSPELMGTLEAEVQGLRFAGRGGIPKVGSGELVVRQISRAEAEALTGLKPMPGGTIGGLEDYFVPSKVKFSEPGFNLSPSMKAKSGQQTFWKVASHGEMPMPRPAGMESHHGVNSVWMEANFTGYNANKSPAVLMFNNPYHNATRGVFNRFRSEIAARQGVSVRNIDWSQVSPGSIWRLSEEQFDAAMVPLDVRTEFYRQFNEYLDSFKE